MGSPGTDGSSPTRSPTKSNPPRESDRLRMDAPGPSATANKFQVPNITTAMATGDTVDMGGLQISHKCLFRPSACRT